MTNKECRFIAANLSMYLDALNNDGYYAADVANTGTEMVKDLIIALPKIKPVLVEMGYVDILQELGI